MQELTHYILVSIQPQKPVLLYFINGRVTLQLAGMNSNSVMLILRFMKMH
jgi:hypothetical protein